MNRLLSLTLIACTLCWVGCWKKQPIAIQSLEFVSAYPIETDLRVELSGLTMHDGRLFTVADKHENQIFEILLEEGRARLVTHKNITAPEKGRIDWEGISADREGNFFLASEAHARIGRLPHDSNQVTWWGPSVSEFGKSKGLFTKRNAGLEGLVWLSDGVVLLAAEREARGWIEVNQIGPDFKLFGRGLNVTRFGSELSLFRIPDFSGFSFSDGAPWALFRNAHLIVRLEKTEGGYEESSEAYSYAFAENDPQFAYLDTRYGQAEGLAIDGDLVYIVIDNNLGGRQANPQDERPLLFVFKIPPKQ